jgi:hypothetical protein
LDVREVERKSLSTLGLSNENGKFRAGLTVDESRPMLHLADKNTKVIWSTP